MRTCTSLLAVKFKLMAEARMGEYSLVYCWKCGSELREDAAFCSKCGASVRGTMGLQSPTGGPWARKSWVYGYRGSMESQWTCVVVSSGTSARSTLSYSS